MFSASSVTSAGNCAAAVSKMTCRKRWLAVRGIALRLTITTSAQDGSAPSARTTAAPTCPVPPMIKTRNAILSHVLPSGFMLLLPRCGDGLAHGCARGAQIQPGGGQRRVDVVLDLHASTPGHQCRQNEGGHRE